ncbi:GPW/gp25 family protein [Chitinophaga nivalis]|uniref:GPW/gp25 family protein n=1 Tax=Chitinophaga nivalis TaxID=2991709 RepID=A0ABT3IRG5_9BACT|nr:GPW/gp25 family protein [Chitinophaga nivalis]MCW3463839.1 GPW/gp25 family protein [Chitinophaga nivalis]MCW3486471.1 GPW/gp25 family protein [Chitinophaga nivalis]
MQGKYYALPIRFAALLQQKELPGLSPEAAIAQHLHLLITTVPGENKADPHYGCQWWEHDFDIKAADHTIKEQIETAVCNAIKHYEKRLSQLTVTAEVQEEEVFSATAGYKMKKKIRLTITGAIVMNNHPFQYSSSFYISPLSYD